MKIKLELFGASRDFSNKDHLEFNIKGQLEIKDFRKEIINYLDKNFKGNESFIKIVKNSGHNWRKVDKAISPTRDEIVQTTIHFFVSHLK